MEKYYLAFETMDSERWGHAQYTEVFDTLEDAKARLEEVKEDCAECEEYFKLLYLVKGVEIEV